MSLPALVKDRLINRDRLDIGLKKSNEYRVREYIKNYLNDLEEIVWILNTLPGRQFKKLFKDEDVYRLLEIAERALVNLNFMPIKRTDDGKLIVEKSLVASPLSGSPKIFTSLDSREATDHDKARFSTLHKHIARLETFVRPEGQAIYSELDKTYYKELIELAKRDGYKPATFQEIDNYLPRLSPAQTWFRERQQFLDGYGFPHIECPSDLEIFRDALRSDEGKALMEKFKSMLEQPSK